MTNLKRLLSFTRPYRPRMGAAVVAMIGVAIANATIVFMVQPVIDVALDAAPEEAVVAETGEAPGAQPAEAADGDTDESLLASAEFEDVLTLAGVIVLLYLALGVARYVSSYLMGSVGFGIVRDLRVHVYRHLVFQPLGFHARRSTGGLMSRVTSDVLALQEALTRVLVDLMRESMTLVGLVAVMFYWDWLLAACVLTAAPLLASIIDRLGRRLRRVSREAQQGLGEISALLQETLTGIRVVKAFGMEVPETEKFRRASERLFRHSLKAERLASIGSPMMEFIGACAGAAVLVYGSWQIRQGNLQLGELTSFLVAAFATYAPLRRLSSANVRVQAAASAADRLFEILDEPLEPLVAAKKAVEERKTLEVRLPEPQKVPPPPLVESIRFESVSFAYPEADETPEPVLHDVELEIPAGRSAALVGPSGAGKSTIANLIPRFYEPTSGRVTIDGVDLREICLDDLRAQIAMVTQETILFNDSVRNNIAYCRPDIADEAIEGAARAAFAHDFIQQLPRGYDTVLGERGLRLSGGQRQRIAIARALLKNAPILILDEATSNLDVRSDRLVQEALTNLIAGRTTLIIAHRLSTIQNADLIAVVEGGRIVEHGTHEQLLSRMGAYQRLYSLHLAGSAEPGFTLET